MGTGEDRARCGQVPAWLTRLLLTVAVLIAMLPARQNAEQGRASATGKPPASDLPWLPSGPEGPVPFGAYSTRLAFTPDWDRLWPVSQVADVVVRFGDAEPRFVFWRGTSYIPCWATRRGAWFTNEFFERRGGPSSGTTSMVEPMSDKKCRYSNVRILENTDARVVVHWRYAPVDLNFTTAYVDPETGWGDWADEYYYLYPDAVGVRKATLHTTALQDWIEYQESIVVNQPGATPEDSLNLDALTLLNLKGEQRTYTWTSQGGPPLRPLPAAACVQVVNLKSLWRPFSIVNPEGASFETYSGHAPGSHFNFWNHWPVSQDKSDTRVADSADRPSHSSLSHIKWTPFTEDHRSRTWVMMHGMTKLEVGELVSLAASWLRPPELKVLRGECTSRGYDPAQRAYILDSRSSGKAMSLDLSLRAAGDSPLVNAALLIRNWGSAELRLNLNGRTLERGSDFELGRVSTLDGIDLVIWVRIRTSEPVRLTLTPV